MNSMKPITEFSGPYRWLSNFWPCRVTLDGMEFSSVEAAYVASKTTDKSVREQIQQLDSPGKCKRFGKSLTLRGDWDSVRLPIMESLLRQKFTATNSLGRRLFATGSSEIIEGNTWGDTFWGVCDGSGENHLGRLLMIIRADIASERLGGMGNKNPADL